MSTLRLLYFGKWEAWNLNFIVPNNKQTSRLNILEKFTLKGYLNLSDNLFLDTLAKVY